MLGDGGPRRGAGAWEGSGPKSCLTISRPFPQLSSEMLQEPSPSSRLGKSGAERMPSKGRVLGHV